MCVCFINKAEFGFGGVFVNAVCQISSNFAGALCFSTRNSETVDSVSIFIHSFFNFYVTHCKMCLVAPYEKQQRANFVRDSDIISIHIISKGTRGKVCKMNFQT